MKKMTEHAPKRPPAASPMNRVESAIAARGLTLKAAAAAIGVGVQTLQNHLLGEHVRSDSMRKYENWLAGRAENRNVFVLPTRRTDEPSETEFPPAPMPDRARLVVDIFSGCGGLSLGFDLYGNGGQFRTILAVDNQAAPIAVLNQNARLMGHADGDVGRQMDLTEFMNEAEFLAFYVGHVATVSGDDKLQGDLNGLSGGAMPAFLKAMASADQAYVTALNDIRGSLGWRQAYEGLDRQSLNQTSVASFHDKLRLPRPSLRTVSLPRVLWGGEGKAVAKPLSVGRPDLQLAALDWDLEVDSLADRREASGRGQLTASARRVGAFVAFLETAAMVEVRKAWIAWRARRGILRMRLFGNEEFATALRELYAHRCAVSVLVGGPPCQGFSRIGRGKLRSLRDALVQVHGSAEVGDTRNLLFQQYVMVLGALRPDAFIFENVQHFQSTVKVDGVEFQATEVLAEAIANMSDGAVAYEVSSRILDASRFGVPQTRQRYFMAGVISSGDGVRATEEAESCLALRRLPDAQLSLALAGLSPPNIVGGETTGGGAMSSQAAVVTLGDHPYTRWIRQTRPGHSEAPLVTDGHAARAARVDDAAFFALMGPGKRWMDYRADDSETVDALGSLIDALLSLPDASLAVAGAAAGKVGQNLLDREGLKALRVRIDGSLPLRLLLEQASEKLGAPHHLLAESYLAKRDGHHGDWIARMDAGRPAKTMVSHMGKDTYAFVHPSDPRTISVREAARVQSFPDWFSLDVAALTDAFKMIGNAVPPLLSHGIADRVARVLSAREAMLRQGRKRVGA